MAKQKIKINSKKEPPETMAILLIFSLDTFKLVVKALSYTKMCHGELFMEDAKAMHKIVTAIAAGEDSVLI